MSINNRWFQLIASLIAMIMIANLQYAWTLFVDPMQKQTGWALSDIQGAFALFILFQTWVQPLDGWLVDRLGPRWFITAAGVLCGVGWAGMGYATSLPMLYTSYCAAGMGAAFVYSCSIGSALKWFKEKRGLASGIMAAGFGGGTALFIPVISSLIATRGYQATFVATGIFQGLVILIVAQFLRHPPAQPAAPAPAAAAGTSQIGKRQFTTFEMLSTPQFYWMYVGVRPDGDRRAARHGERRANRQVVGIFGRSAHARGHAQPNRQRRQPCLLGLGLGSTRSRDDDGADVRLAGCLPGISGDTRPAIRRLVRRHARRGVLHLGPDLFALPVDVRRLLRHATRDIELRA